MWLSKEERRLLAGYYRNIGNVDKEVAYHEGELFRLLKHFSTGKTMIALYEGIPSGETDLGKVWKTKGPEEMRIQMHNDAIKRRRLEVGNSLLAERGLISVQPHQNALGVVKVKLKVDGYDYGRRYAHWITSSGLWFNEYRYHWIWVLASFLGGGLMALLVNCLTKAKP